MTAGKIKNGLFGSPQKGIGLGMERASRVKKRKKYRLKPAAKRFYRRVLIVSGILLVAVAVLRFTFMRKTFTLYGYDTAHPFEVQGLLVEKIKPKKEEDLILMDLTLRTDSGAAVASFRLDMIELISNERYQEWTLEVSGGRSCTKAAALPAI